MDCLSSEDLKGRRRNSLCLTAYAKSWCCQAIEIQAALRKLRTIPSAPATKYYSSDLGIL